MHHFVAIGEFKLELQSRNAQFGSKSTIVFSRVTLKFEGWPWKTIGHLYSPKEHQALSINPSSYVDSNWSYSPETAKLGYDLVSLTFDLWPWPFAWTSLLSLVTTPENLIMIRSRKHSQKGVTDRQTDRPMDWNIHIAAWSQLKNRHEGDHSRVKIWRAVRKQWILTTLLIVKFVSILPSGNTNYNMFSFITFFSHNVN